MKLPKAAKIPDNITRCHTSNHQRTMREGPQAAVSKKKTIRAETEIHLKQNRLHEAHRYLRCDYCDKFSVRSANGLCTSELYAVHLILDESGL